MKTINLQQFCAPDFEEREHLRQPWVHKGLTYASNGHIIVRVPAGDPAAVFPHKTAESALKLFADAKKSEYIELPRFSKPAACDACRSKGKTMQAQCGDCGGKGTFRHGRHDYDCLECDAAGWVLSSRDDPAAILRSCEFCDGRGHHRGDFVHVGNAHFDAVYLLWMKALPSLRISTDGPRAAHFTFDGGEGLLMPRRADS